MFFMFTPIWLIFFKRVESTNKITWGYPYLLISIHSPPFAKLHAKEVGRRDSAGGELCLRFTFGVQGLGLCKTPEMAELNRLHIIMEVGWKIIFHSKWVICRFQPLIFQGVNQFFLVGFQIPMMCNGWTRSSPWRPPWYPVPQLSSGWEDDLLYSTRICLFLGRFWLPTTFSDFCITQNDGPRFPRYQPQILDYDEKCHWPKAICTDVSRNGGAPPQSSVSRLEMMKGCPSWPFIMFVCNICRCKSNQYIVYWNWISTTFFHAFAVKKPTCIAYLYSIRYLFILSGSMAFSFPRWCLWGWERWFLALRHGHDSNHFTIHQNVVFVCVFSGLFQLNHVSGLNLWNLEDDTKIWHATRHHPGMTC